MNKFFRHSLFAYVAVIALLVILLATSINSMVKAQIANNLSIPLTLQENTPDFHSISLYRNIEVSALI